MSGELTQARLDVMTVMTAIQSAWSTYALKIEAEDRDTIDLATQTDPWIKVQSIKNLKGDQADMSSRPLVRQNGQIVLYVKTREGSGSLIANTLLDFMRPYLEFKNLTLLRTKVFEPQDARIVDGIRYAPVVINYWYHRLSG